METTSLFSQCDVKFSCHILWDFHLFTINDDTQVLLYDQLTNEPPIKANLGKKHQHFLNKLHIPMSEALFFQYVINIAHNVHNMTAIPIFLILDMSPI